MKIQEFKNAAEALATRNESEANLAWPMRSGGNPVSREDEERRCGQDAHAPVLRADSSSTLDIRLLDFRLFISSFQLSVFCFLFYPQGWDKCWYRQKISEKKFRSLSIPHLRVPLKHAKCGVSRFKWADKRMRGKSSGA
jgi:hypothetical protein